MIAIDRILLQNKAWSQHEVQSNPQFELLARAQSPHTMWIGCSDSRLSVSKITDTELGEIFVHRNIANLAIPDDFNMLSVLEYAVCVLRVRHVVVCGHYGCGGVLAAYNLAGQAEPSGFLHVGQWLERIQAVHRLHQTELDAVEGEDARLNRLVELNTIAQVHNLAQTEVIRRAWDEQASGPSLHGMVFDIRTGLLKPLIRLLAPALQREAGPDQGVAA